MASGACYTADVPFYLLKKTRYMHSVFTCSSPPIDPALFIGVSVRSLTICLSGAFAVMFRIRKAGSKCGNYSSEVVSK